MLTGGWKFWIWLDRTEDICLDKDNQKICDLKFPLIDDPLKVRSGEYIYLKGMEQCLILIRISFLYN